MRARTLHAGALPLLALLSACFGRGGGEQVDAATLQRVRDCGGGLSFSRSFRLAVASDLQDRSLSAERTRDIRAAIFAKVPARDRAAVFETYTACITSERERGELLSEILMRRDEFGTRLREQDVLTSEQIAALLDYYDREHAAARDGNFVEARRQRGELVMRFAMLTIGSSGPNVDGVEPPAPFYPPVYEPPPPPPSGGGGEELPQSAAPAPSPAPVPSPALPPPPPSVVEPTQAFLALCASVEDPLLCQDAAARATGQDPIERP